MHVARHTSYKKRKTHRLPAKQQAAAWVSPASGPIKEPLFIFAYRTFFLFVLLTALALYRIKFAGLNWGLDRLVLSLCALSFGSFVLLRGKLRQAPTMFSALLFLSILPSVFNHAVDRSLQAHYLPTILQVYLTFFIAGSLLLMVDGSIPQLCRTLRFLGWGYAGFATWSVYQLYVVGKPITHYPFYHSLPLPLAEVSEHFAGLTQSAFRIALPFSTPQALAMASGALCVVFFWCYCLQPCKQWLLACVIQGFICVLTLSKSGIFSLAAVFLIMKYLLVKLNDPATRKLTNRLFRFVFGFMAIGLLLFIGNQIADTAGARRIISFSGSGSFDGHLFIRLHAFQVFLESNVWEQFFGHGIGNFQRVALATSGHMTYSTLIIERGLFGFLCVVGPFGWLWLRLARSLQSHDRQIMLHRHMAFCILTFLFLNNALYDVHSITVQWILLGLCVAIAWRHNKPRKPAQRNPS